MIYWKWCPPQMSFSIMRSCVRNPELLSRLGILRSEHIDTSRHLRLCRCYAEGKHSLPVDVFAAKIAKSERQSRLAGALKALSVDAKTEKARYHDRHEMKVTASEEVWTTGVPAVIRQLVPSLFLTDTHSYSGRVYPIPRECYYEIKRPMKTSRAYDSLCLKMMVPCELVTGFFGPLALLKLCEMTETGTSVFSLYHNNEAVAELFDIVTEQVYSLDKNTLTRLLYYQFALKDFSKKCSKKVFSKFMITMNEHHYTITELLALLESLKAVESNISDPIDMESFEKVTTNIWDHISRRRCSISVYMLAKLYSAAPANHEGIFAVLNEILTDNIDLMDVCDMFVILKEIQMKTESPEVLTSISEWLDKNLNILTVADLEKLLSSYLKSKFINPTLLSGLTKVISSVNVKKSLSTRLICQILSYCMLGRHYDEDILETACDHYIEHACGYTSEQLHCLLQAIGSLNFVPKRQVEFFSKVELHLMENFYNIDVLNLLEMFVYLIYIDKVAVNFEPYIFAPLFLGIVSEMEGDDRVKGVKCLNIIKSAFTAQGFEPQLFLPGDTHLDELKTVDLGHVRYVVPEFNNILQDKTLIQTKLRPTQSSQYVEIKLAETAGAGREGTFQKEMKFGFLVMTEDAFCKNDMEHMLGHEMANIRMLQANGLTVAWVHIDKIMEYRKQKKLGGFLKSLLLHILDTTEENTTVEAMAGTEQFKPDEDMTEDKASKEIYEYLDDV